MPDPTALTSEELLALVQDARWFGAKDKTPESAEIVDLPVQDPVVTLALVEVRFGTGTHEHYLLDFAADGGADVLERPEVASRLAELSGLDADGAEVESLGVEQSNSSVILDGLHVLKLYRRLEAGPNPEIEMLRALAEEGFTNAPRRVGGRATAGPPRETSHGAGTRRVTAEGGG
jgi:predicted trehalose synthase